MPEGRFEPAVRVRLQGSNTVRDVASVNDACEVLTDWPQASRGPFYRSAREIVEAALRSDASSSQAREAFLALAEHSGILER